MNKANDPEPPSVPLPPPSGLPNISVLTGPLPGLRELIRHPIRGR